MYSQLMKYCINCTYSFREDIESGYPIHDGIYLLTNNLPSLLCVVHTSIMYRFNKQAVRKVASCIRSWKILI